MPSRLHVHDDGTGKYTTSYRTVDHNDPSARQHRPYASFTIEYGGTDVTIFTENPELLDAISRRARVACDALRGDQYRARVAAKRVEDRAKV